MPLPRGRGIYLVIAVSALLAGITAGLPIVHAAETYKVQAFPFYSQEGSSSITLILNVGSASPSTAYQFIFIVRDPTNTNCTSTAQYTTSSTETQFYIIQDFPGPQFTGTCSHTALVGGYNVYVDQIKPVVKRDVSPGVIFYIGLIDSLFPYQRTQTVKVQAIGYRPGEVATVAIRTTSTLTLVFSNTTMASAGGVVTSAWKIPRNATIVESYIVTVSGTLTVKSPSDAQGFYVQAAPMTIPSLDSLRATYQRTETLTFSFRALYPDGSAANAGGALVTLTRPDRVNITLTASYDVVTQRFVARYKTTSTNETGTWTASLPPNSFDDGNGNVGPSATVLTSPQLQPATLTVSIASQSSYPLGQPVIFNATIQYPDGSNLQPGSAYAFLAFTGGFWNDSVPISYDSGLHIWVGSYTPNNYEPGGLWSLIVSASDTATPTNTGRATKAITLPDHPPSASFTESTTNTLTGVAINFDGTTSYDPDGWIVTYSWNFGDGSTGTGATLSHSYTNTGNALTQTFTVTLTVTDNSGSTASNTALITINDRHPVAAFTASPNSTAPGQSITFNGSGANDPDGTISAYAWNFGDGSTGTGLLVTHSFTSTGAYTVTLQVTDNSGLTNSSFLRVSIQYSPPAVTFTSSSTRTTVGQSISFDASGTTDPDGTITSYTWDFGDGSTGTGLVATHSYSGPGNYTVRLTATDSNGLRSSSTSTISITATPPSSGNASFPLYYFGILVALIAAMLAGGFMYFRRHKVTHAKLKIDLEAVKSEAGRIENQEFFQSVKDQLKKDKDD